MHRSMVDYHTTDVKIIKHRALRAAFRGDDAVTTCRRYIDTHAGPGKVNNCGGSPVIAAEQFNFHQLFYYEKDQATFLKLRNNIYVGGHARHADGFNSHQYVNQHTFVFMDPKFDSIRDYFRVADYLQSIENGIGALMLIYPVNTAFPIEDFHTMLHNEVGGVNFLIKRKRISLTRYYCMFSSDVSVIPEWERVLDKATLVSSYRTQESAAERLFEKAL